MTVVQALYESLNVPTAYVGNELGPATIVKTAHEMGIHEDLQAYLPISIGADETTLLELTSAYQVFATEGDQSPPYAVEAVIDAKGHLIYQHEDQSNRIIRPAVAYLITGALKAVLRYGTGASAGGSGSIFRRRARPVRHRITRTRTSSATRRRLFAASGSASTSPRVWD